MRVLIQRVTQGCVSTEGNILSGISKGYVVLLGIKEGDTEKEAELLAEKTVHLRVMPDELSKMNRSLLDTHGEILVISQFTLYADTSTGRRPSFIRAAKPDIAEKLYLFYIDHLQKLGVKSVKTGKFGAYMHVALVNDGPLTILLDSDEIKKSKIRD